MTGPCLQQQTGTMGQFSKDNRQDTKKLKKKSPHRLFLLSPFQFAFQVAWLIQKNIIILHKFDYNVSSFMTLILEILRLLLRKTTGKPTNTQSNQYQREQQKSILKNNFHQFTQKNNFLPCLSSSSISIFSFAATA